MMNPISTWLCPSNTKNLFVKIVHLGGHVELHDRPILAAELLNRNPKCCLAYPTVFQQPHAIISPDTTLTLGQKYYVVPLGTIRKLQLKYPRSVLRENQQTDFQRTDCQNETDSACWLIRNKSVNDKKTKKGKNGCARMSGGLKFRAISSSESSKDSENKTVCSKKRAKKDLKRVENGGASPGRLPLTSVDNWQPGLEIISEE